jgi:hypothetical protein
MWNTVSLMGKTLEVFTPRGMTESEPRETAAERANSPAEPRVVIYLHGHGEERLSENETFTRLFEEHRLIAVCPRGGPCWWLDEIYPPFDPELTPLEFVRNDVVRWIGEEFGAARDDSLGAPAPGGIAERSGSSSRTPRGAAPPGIGLLGLSMGGQGVLNLAYRDALRFPVVAAISPAIDFHTIHGRGFQVEEIFPDAETARQATVTLQLHPLHWPRYQFFACDPQDPTWFEGCERLASKLNSSGILFECDLTTSHGGHNWEYFNRMAEKAVAFVRLGLDRHAG